MSERIKICLNQKHMSLKDLSSKVRIPLTTLYDLMNNKTKKIDIQKAKDISIVLGCSLDYLIDADLIPEKIGNNLKKERKRQGFSLSELSQATCIPLDILQAFEKSEEQINLFLLKKICEVYAIPINQVYSENTPGEEVIRKNNDLPSLNRRDERSIQKRLQAVLNDLMPENGALAFYNDEEPFTEEDKALLRISLENTIRLAKQMAKQKYTPKKYRK